MLLVAIETGAAEVVHMNYSAWLTMFLGDTEISWKICDS